MAKSLSPEGSHRTQITLTRDQYRQLTELAARRGTSMALLVREAVAQYVVQGEGSWLDDPLGIIGLAGASGERDGSVNHDDVIYREE